MKKIYALILISILPLASCTKFLDVVPDNIATIENAFTIRSAAQKYLFTCYSYMPKHSLRQNNPALMGADELWYYNTTTILPMQIATGSQGTVAPVNNYWDGEQNATALYKGLRDCNIFLDNISKVRDLGPSEEAQWVAEVKVLKAYYHFWLFRMYGPIPLIRVNLPISTSVDDVQIKRAPVDECVDYIVQLLDEAINSNSLPLIIQNQATDLGRITQPIALSLKAQVLVTAASPLFNGNTDYANFKDKDGVQLFNPTYDAGKWQKGVDACKAAIDACNSANMKLYTYSQDPLSATVSTETNLKLSFRNAVSSKWSSELIWGNSNTSTSDIQVASQPRLDYSAVAAGSLNSDLAPTLKMVEMFYSKNGVPITEDVTWNYANKLNLRTAVTAEKYYVKEGYQTIQLHFDREPRFYASLGFDGGVWYGQGQLVEANSYTVQSKLGQVSAKNNTIKYSITGYFPQKLVNYLSVYSATASYSPSAYTWPIMRLSDLYLLYAEALNEVNNQAEAYIWINKVRDRAGLKTVQDAWTQYSTNPTKFTTQSGLRDIIHRERAIELAFEGQRFWDLRRWKEAIKELNGPVLGWDVNQADVAGFYRQKVLFNQTFKTRDYFWPIKEYDVIVNKNLVQNPGW
ncbi:RagB/SusD family nutrient uptake outer membrane protein [Mucilaginibacter sp. AW1-3]